jgi:DNA-binding MarR family transcriptional regulator
MNIGQKHHAMLEEAQRRGHSGVGELRLCFELLALTAAIDRDCAARLAPHQLSEGRFVLLFLLRGQPDGLSPHELAERAGVTRATITGLLDGLERDGFLTRHHATDDRRKITVRLTERGETTATTLFREHAEWIGSLFSDLSADESRLLSALLDRIWQKTDAGRSKACS